MATPSMTQTPPASPPSTTTAPAPNLFLGAPPLAPSASTTTTASATTTASSSAPDEAAGGDDKRLHNMPKALATACVRAFIQWGHDHKGDPPAYQAFLRQELPRFPGVEGEKVRLYMKNIAAAYHERYLPARSRESRRGGGCLGGGMRSCACASTSMEGWMDRTGHPLLNHPNPHTHTHATRATGGYSGDFLVWWEHRPGRGRPKKNAAVPLAYSIPSSAGRANRQAAAAARAGGQGGGDGGPKQRRRAPSTKKKAATAAKAKAKAKRGGGKKGGGGGGAGVQRARAASASSCSGGSASLCYVVASDTEGSGSDGEEDWDMSSSGGGGSSDDDDDDEGAYGRGGGHTRTSSRSGRVIRPPTDPYLLAVREEDRKRARIEAALAMVRPLLGVDDLCDALVAVVTD